MRTRIRTPTQGQKRRHAAIIAAAAFSVVFGAASFGMINQPPALHEKTLCLTDRKLETSVVILVDTTDALSPTQISQLLARVRETRDGLPTHGKLTLLFIDSASPNEPKEIFSLCNPGSEKNSNPLIQTASKIKKRWDESFGNPVEQAISTLATAPISSRSPLIQAIIASTQRSDFNTQVGTRRLLIVSDLLQHEQGYSHYTTSSRNLWVNFSRTSLAPETVGALSNVAVEVVYIRRPKDAIYQGEGHRVFWQRWFEEARASSINFIGMPRK